MTHNVGDRVEFGGETFLVTAIQARAKDGSRKVTLQEVLPLDGVGEPKDGLGI